VWCQQQTAAPPPPPAKEQKKPLPDSHRIFGFIPNFQTVTADTLPPMSVREKFGLAARDSFDPSSFVLAGFYAGIGQLTDQYPTFGLGAEGYGKRFLTAYADQVSGNYLSEAIVPALFHDDPRFYRLGTGSGVKRTWAALRQLWVTRTDRGTESFNVPELLGNGLAAAVSNAYYPAEERTVGETLGRWGVQIGSDAGFNILKEFWPDMRQHMPHRHEREDDEKTFITP
jgi:hypothetical protein